MRWLAPAILLACLGAPSLALAWGYEGHEVIADIARRYLAPSVQAKIDAILAADQENTLTEHDMASEATWADRFRSAGHPETGAWHFVDTKLDHPDLKSACFGFPPSGTEASQGPAQDCVIEKLEEFSKELGDSATSPAERLVALKFVLHLAGDLHQPLHAADNHDKGGNCVLLALGGPRTVNLHSYWDTSVVQAMGSDPAQIAASLVRRITPAQRAAWEKGGVKDWAMESYGVARSAVYTLNSKPGCAGDQAPMNLPTGYDQTAKAAAAVQLEKAGVRLALLLNRAFAS